VAQTVEQVTDYTVEDLGTMWRIITHTPAARQWVEENVGEIEDYLGTTANFLGDWRPMRDIARGMRDEGLVGAGLPWHTDENAEVRWHTGG
jgi:hypothetical protein